jgi:SagB-type dehydrogenase family enzyme
MLGKGDAYMKTHREWLKSDRWDLWQRSETDQRKEIPPPPVQLPCPEGAQLIDLIPPGDFKVGRTPFIDTVRNRKSRRRFTDQPISLEDLSFLLWSTQGVREVFRDGKWTRRTVPSGGSRHPFETYLLVNRVDGVEPGMYRYLPLDHRLCRLDDHDAMMARVEPDYRGFVSNPAVIFVWTVIPYRTEWRYSMISDKIIALDAGHICQNLYLACEALHLGTCAYDGYDQDTLDKILAADGEDEFTIYLATVGHPGED